jgi:4-carboxymuconolactone decarboxylase
MSDATTSASGGSTEMFEQGLQMRRQVLGAAHVDRSMAQVSEFSRPVQELVTEYCWGAIWTRPGLEPKTRSLLNLVMLTAMNRSHELAVHVRGALTNGCTREEIQEALLQTLVYCGAPAALEAFRVAERVLDEAENA